MTLNEIKKRVNKKIKWLDHYDPNRGEGTVRIATVLEVKGRNIRIVECGVQDWKWYPDMSFIEEVPDEEN